MARIPAGEGLGDVVARPQRFNETQVPRAAFGEGVARGMGEAGALVAGADEAAAREAERREQERLRRVLATREAANRAQAETVLQAASTDLDALGDEYEAGVRAGTIDKRRAIADWQRVTKERVASAVEDLPPELRPIVETKITGYASRRQRGVARAIQSRDQTEVRAGIDATIEHASRLYLKDPAAADELVRRSLTEQGPFSGLDAAQLARLGQTYRETSRFTRAAALVTDARRDNAALDRVEQLLAGDEFADLDPQRRITLAAQIEGFKVANVQRAQAATERRERRAARAFETLQTLDAQGLPANLEFLSSTLAQLKGTSYEEAAMQIVAGSAAGVRFGALPLGEQRRVLAGEYAKAREQGVTPAISARLRKMEGIHNASERGYKDDPWEEGVRRGVIDTPVPLDLSGPDALAKGLAGRGAQIEVLDRQAGRQVTPLRPQEAQILGDMLESLPITGRVRFLGGIGKVIGGRRLEDLSRQLGANSNDLGIAAAMEARQARTQSGRSVAEIYLQGREAISKKIVSPDDMKDAPTRAKLYGLIGDAYMSPALRDAMVDVAVALWAGQKATGQQPSAEGVVRLATGGITEFNGRKVPLPYGIAESEFKQRVRAVTPAAIAPQLPDGKVYLGGRSMGSMEFLAGLPRAQLVHAGQGRYAVTAGGAIAANAQGAPLILDLNDAR